ncbi:MAG TPA: hypothetical protein VH878_05500, partial [Thermodesulfobacteriota bacterium]
YEVLNEDMAKACLSAIWLYHNYLQESHKISQTIQARDGSYWHGIMHRRDLDFNNSKYWFRQVGEHPIFEPLRIFAKVITSKSEPDKSTEFFLKQSIWDPIAFINLCEACIKGRSPSEMLCRKIQQKEWQLLFDYCYWYAIKH